MTAPATPSSMSGNGTAMRRAAFAAMAVATVLAVTKLAAWWVTGSVAMLASFADSALDLGASTLNALAIHHALVPADREHRFGHGKTEAVAGLAQSAIVGGSALFLAYESILHILHAEPLINPGWGYAVIALSITATLALTTYQAAVIRQTKSLAVSADYLHYVTDLLGNIAVLVAFVLAGTFGLVWADGALGLLIAVTLAWGAWSILHQSFDQLIDRELPDDERARIKQIVSSEAGVISLHDLRTRQSGLAIFIQCHVVLDADQTLAKAHAIADRVEQKLMAAYPGSEVLVHQDPLGEPDDTPTFASTH